MRMPYSFSVARTQLESRVVGAAPERVRRRALGEAARQDFAISGADAGEIRIGAVIRVGGESWPVTTYMSDVWRTDPQDLLRAALEISRERIESTPYSLAALGTGAWRTKSVDQVPLLLHTGAVRRIPAAGGDVVVLIPTHDAAFVTGADDLAGLARIAEAAAAALSEDPLAAVTAMPVVWRDAWVPFAWPDPAAARWRDRRAAGELATAVGRVEAAFAAALEAIDLDIRTNGLAVRRHLGSATSDENVLDGWVALATAFGLDGVEAARVREAAADTLAFFDAHEKELRAGGFSFSRDTFRAEHELGIALERHGSLVTVSRKDQSELIAMDAAAAPAARAAGATIRLEENYDDVVAYAEDVSRQMYAYGVHVVSLGDAGEDIRMVFFPSARSAEVEAAERRIGDDMLLYWL